jgi:hypothetical protein
MEHVLCWERGDIWRWPPSRQLALKGKTVATSSKAVGTTLSTWESVSRGQLLTQIGRLTHFGRLRDQMLRTQFIWEPQPSFKQEAHRTATITMRWVSGVERDRLHVESICGLVVVCVEAARGRATHPAPRGVAGPRSIGPSLQAEPKQSRHEERKPVDRRVASLLAMTAPDRRGCLTPQGAAVQVL